jgi:hypothetical protein
MSLPPVAIRADLAEPGMLAAAALGCPAMVRARKLAAWVGPGRELTSSGVLRPAVAAEACRALGIAAPSGRLRSALDVDELMRDWMTAVAAGLLALDGRHVRAVPGPAGDPRLVLGSWAAAAAGVLGVPDEPCPGCLAVLLALSEADEPLGMAELAGAVQAVTEPEQGEPCPECGTIHPADSSGLAGISSEEDEPFGQGGFFGELLDDDEFPGDDEESGSEEHAEGTVAGLAAFGAAAVTDGTVRLTPLGRELAAAVFQGCAPAADQDAAALVSVISEVPPVVARELAKPWLAARSAADAVRELLAFAESAGAGQRVAALAYAREAGPEAAPAWREWALRPGFGAYARQWLAAQGEPGAADPTDEAWLTVDALSILLGEIGDMLPPFLLAGLLQQQFGADGAAEALELLGASGHPAASAVMAALGGPAASRPRPGGKARSRAEARPRSGRPGQTTAYQLKISLRGVSKPPVWRRVLVPSALTLDLLHEVILASMGWDGGHLHVFSDGWREYGEPDGELGHADERRVRLDGILAKPGDKLRYTYDFGDGWEHDVLLERIAAAVPAGDYPSCLEGKGACPPEDCGGAWGYAQLKQVLSDPGHEEHQEMLDWLGGPFDPRAFSAAAVNARLRRVTAARSG